MPLEFGDLIGWAISLLGVFTGVVFGLVKLLLFQFEKRLGERFAAQEEARKAAVERQEKDAQALQQLERNFLKFQAELPLNYVRREDWVRGQSVIEAKLDGLALKFENILLKGGAQ